jgi:hypothetical protein
MKKITAGAKQYDLYWTFGKVEETGKNLETKVSGSGGGGATFKGYGGTAPVSITSTTTVHDQIFLVDNSGNEHAYQLQDMNVACRTSNQLSVIWAIKEGQKTGPYIAVFNHTTNQPFFQDKALSGMFRRNGWLVLAAVLVALYLGTYSGIFYLVAVVLPIAWLIEGSLGVKKFKDETNFKEFV